MTKTKTNTFKEHHQRATLETFDLWNIWSEVEATPVSLFHKNQMTKEKQITLIIFPVGGGQRETIDKEGNEEVVERRRRKRAREERVWEVEKVLEESGATRASGPLGPAIKVPLAPLSWENLNYLIYFSLQRSTRKSEDWGYTRYMSICQGS